MSDVSIPHYPYQDPQLSVEQRIGDLYERMSLHDKVGLLFPRHVVCRRRRHRQ